MESRLSIHSAAHILNQNTFSKLDFSHSSNAKKKIPTTEFSCDYQTHILTQWADKQTIYLNHQKWDQRDPKPILP